MALRSQERERGLAALNEARQVRRRAIVFGRVRLREAATGFWLVSLVGLAVFGSAYHRYAQVELDARRSEVFARQRAVAAAVGTRGIELRDRIEAWVIALARGELAPVVTPEARLDDISNEPGIYLRIRQSDALSVESIRKAAKGSLRDGFTSCLFVGETFAADRGIACVSTSQCGSGEVCNDWQVCATPGRPYNLDLLYEGLRVLTPEWTSSLKAASDEFQVRVIDLGLQSAGKHESVAAVELVRRSKYFTAVLDQEAQPGTEPTLAAAADESIDEQLQAVDHRVRVGIWDLQRAMPLIVIDVEAAGRFVRLGSGATTDLNTLRAQQRQANNCAAAIAVREALTARRVRASDAADAQTPRSGE
jgi:hypothetical protein